MSVNKMLQTNFPHIFLSEVDSTNLFASKLTSKTNPTHGFCVFTDFQSAGKGQYGREWQSERGKNLLCSFIFNRPSFYHAELFDLHLWVSLSCLSCLQSFSDKSFFLKWPNDIYVDNKKIGGILIENSWRGSSLEKIIVGIGININQLDFPAQLNASSLALIEQKEFQITEIIQSLYDTLLDTEKTMLDEGSASFLKKYNHHLYRKNEWLPMHIKNMGELQVKILEVNANGELVVNICGEITSLQVHDVIT